MVKKLLSLATGVVSMMVLALVIATSAQAEVLENSFVSLSDTTTDQTSVTYTVQFNHVGTTFGGATFSFCDAPSSTCTLPVSMDVSSAAEGIVEESDGDDAANWAVSVASPVVTSTATTVDTNAANKWEFSFTGIENPAYTSCDSTGQTATCYLRVATFTDTGVSSAADSSTLTFTIVRDITVTATVDASFTLTVAPIDPGDTGTANGTTLTSAITPTVTTLPFGNLTPGTEKYLGHKLTVSTNAVGGYSITVGMNNNMTGTAYNSDIDQFNDGTATVNTTSTAWSEPSGTTSGTDSGWLGVGTDDGDVTGQGSNQFFPLGTTAQTVANQATSASSEQDLVVYAIEVNNFQQADSYEGLATYTALVVF